VLGSDTRLMELYVETHIRIVNHQKKVVTTREYLSSEVRDKLNFNNCFSQVTVFFLIYDSFFHDTYNTRLQEIYRNDPSTRPKLDLDFWLEAKSSKDPIKIGFTYL